MNGEPQTEPRCTAVLEFASRRARRIILLTGCALAAWVLTALVGASVAQAAPPLTFLHNVVGTAPAPTSASTSDTSGADATTPDRAGVPAPASAGMSALTTRPASLVEEIGRHTGHPFAIVVGPVSSTWTSHTKGVGEHVLHANADSVRSRSITNAQVVDTSSRTPSPTADASVVVGALTPSIPSPSVPFCSAGLLGDPPAEMALPDAATATVGHSAPSGQVSAPSGSPAAAGPRARSERADLTGGLPVGHSVDRRGTGARRATTPDFATPVVQPDPQPDRQWLVWRGKAPAESSGLSRVHSVGECFALPVERDDVRPPSQVARPPVPLAQVRDRAGQPTTSPD